MLGENTIEKLSHSEASYRKCSIDRYDSVSLCCTKCSGELKSDGPHFSCQKCGQKIRTCHHVPVFNNASSFDFTYDGIDQELFQHLLAKIDSKGFSSALNSFFATQDLASSNTFFRNTFDLSRSAWKFMLSIPDDAVALDLGCGTGVASIGLAPHCSRVFSCDIAIERVRFLRQWALHEGLENILPFSGSSCELLPFEDKTFDLIVLNGSPPGSLTETLQEARRVLKPSGQLYFGVRNRTGYSNVFEKEKSSLISNGKSIRQPFQGDGKFSRSELSRILKKNGFSDVAFYTPFPSYRRFRQFAPLDGRTRISPPTPPRRHSALLHKFACLPRVLKYTSPSFGVVASSAFQAQSLAEQVTEKLDLSIAEKPLIVSKTGTTIAWVNDPSGQEFILRLPHSVAGRRKCETNARRLQEIHRDPSISEAFKQCVPEIFSSTICNQQFATVESVLEGTSQDRLKKAHLESVWPSIVDVLLTWSQSKIETGEVIAQSRRMVVQLWCSNIARVVRDGTSSKELVKCLSVIEVELNKMRAITMPAHGDLHPGNVLVHNATGEVSGVIDWDVEIPAAPPLLDLLNYSVWADCSGDPEQALFPLRIDRRRHTDLVDLISQLKLPANFMIHLQMFYALWRIADRLDQTILNPCRINSAIQLLQWLNDTLCVSDAAGHRIAYERLSWQR